MKCPHCAAENKEAAKFCGKCGQPLTTSAQNEDPGIAQAALGHVNQMPNFAPSAGTTLERQYLQKTARHTILLYQLTFFIVRIVAPN